VSSFLRALQQNVGYLSTIQLKVEEKCKIYNKSSKQDK